MLSAQNIAVFLSGLGIGSILTAYVSYRLGRSGKLKDARLDADRKLYAELIALMSDQVIDFVRSIGSSFEYEDLDPLRRFEDAWRSPLRRFHDRKVEEARKALVDAVERFLNYVGGETFDLDNGRQGAPPEWKIDQRERYARVVRELGEQAHAVRNAHERFAIVARARLHV